MRRQKMGFTVGQFRVLCLSTALAVSALAPQAMADGDSSRPLAPPPAARVSTTGSVAVDMSALDSVPNRRLLLPGAGAPQTGGPVHLRPPPGVKPFVQAPIRLRPPPGMQVAAPAPAKAPEPKAAEAKMASVTPAPATPPAPAAKAAAAPPPAAKAPAAAAPAAPPSAPQQKATAAPPPAAPKQTQVAVAPPPPATPAAGQPRSLLTPPASPAPAAAAPAPAKTEEVKPAETAKEAPKETTVAVATPPARTPAEPEALTISFKVGGADVPADATAGLKALAAKLAKDPTTRLQLVAYASDPEKSISRSRRLSLERAVNVRKVMLAAGIESTRIDIRALGEQSGTGAPDRVDAITVKR